MDKKDIIIDAAKKAFRQYGIFKTTLDDIGYKCGMKKNSLYYYFKNKEDLLKVVTHSEYCDFIQMQKEFIKKDKPLKEMLTEYFQFRLKESVQFFTDYDLIKMENQAAYHKIFHEESDFLIREELNVIQQILVGRVAPDTDIESLIMMIISINQGLLYKQIFMTNMTLDIQNEIKAIVNTLFSEIKVVN